MQRALGEVVRQCTPGLRRYAITRTHDPDESDDLVQECVERTLLAIRNGHKIDNLPAYLFAALRSLFATRRSHRVRRGDVISIEPLADSLACAPRQMARMEYWDLVSALDELPDGQKEIILMIAVEGLSYRHAADALDIPIGTVMSRLSRGRSMLKRRLEGMITVH